MKICFIQATNPVDVKWHAQGGFGYLKSSLDRAFPGEIEFLVAPTVDEAVAFRPDILGVSSLSQDFEDAVELCTQAKAASVPCVVLGGFHITAFPETLPEMADIGVLGEGEVTFCEVVSSYKNKGGVNPDALSKIKSIVFWGRSGTLVTTEQRPVVPRLDDLPIPDRSFGLAQGQSPYLFTSRGCAYRCSFCCSSRYWPNVRFHSAGRVLAELEDVLAKFPGLGGVSIWDDLFAADRKRLKEIVSLFEAKGLDRRVKLASSVRANLIDDELCGLLKRLNYGQIGFGAESGSDPILKKLKDGTVSVAVNQRALDTAHGHGLKAGCGFVLGHPDETEEDLHATYRFILSNYAAGKLANHEITVLTPMPGTETWEWARNNGFIPDRGFSWKSLRYLALYSNTLSGIEEWIRLREQNGSMYLNAKNVPRKTLYDIIRHYEDRIRRGNYSVAGPTASSGLNRYYLNERPEVADVVPGAAMHILDAGCGGGMLGKALKERRSGRRVTGLELDPGAAEHAKRHLDAVHAADLETFEPPFAEREFDCIIFADVLEHLRDPWSAIKKYASFLKPGGAVIASIPNVRNLGVVRDLVERGTWEYADEGILDRTHLRFFTKRQFLSLLRDADIRCAEVHFQGGAELRAITAADGSMRLGGVTISKLAPAERDELRAFQMIFVGAYEPGYSSRPEMQPAIVTEADKRYRAALALASGDRIEEARAALESLVNDWPDHVLAHNDLGVLSANAGKADQALLHYEQARRLDPANVVVRKNLADFLFAVAGRTDEAFTLYRGILAERPDDSEALYGLGLVSAASGRDQEAALFLSKALKAAPTDPAVITAIKEAGKKRPVQSAPKKQGLHLFRIETHEQFVKYEAATRAEHQARTALERSLIAGSAPFSVEGYCHVCRKTASFQVDFFASHEENGVQVPNWRERLVCPSCGLNNRMRASLHIIQELLRPAREAAIYIAEQTTPVYHWLKAHYPNTVGSEYLNGAVPPGGTTPEGIRNENLTKLTFPDAGLDAVLTFDVFEHIPDYGAAFRETARVLKPGGSLFFSVPFDRNEKKNIIRAEIKPDGTVQHRMPPEYHGDPLNRTEGCLCYQVFGWEMLHELREAGFAKADAYFYWSRDLGYLGGDQMVFAATKK